MSLEMPRPFAVVPERQPTPPGPVSKPRKRWKPPHDPIEESRKACLRSLTYHLKQLQAEIGKREMQLNGVEHAIALLTREKSVEEVCEESKKSLVARDKPRNRSGHFLADGPEGGVKAVTA